MTSRTQQNNTSCLELGTVLVLGKLFFYLKRMAFSLWFRHCHRKKGKSWFRKWRYSV